jgi:hypothetical protein
MRGIAERRGERPASGAGRRFSRIYRKFITSPNLAADFSQLM